MLRSNEKSLYWELITRFAMFLYTRELANKTLSSCTLARICVLVLLLLWFCRLQFLPFTILNCNLKALWLSENQAQPMLKFQTDFDENHGQKVVTCFLLPQQAYQPESMGKCAFTLQFTQRAQERAAEKTARKMGVHKNWKRNFQFWKTESMQYF